MPFRCGDWILSRPWPRVICRAGLLEAPGRFSRKNVKSCEKAGLKGGRRLIGERVQSGTSLSFGKLPNDVCFSCTQRLADGSFWGLHDANGIRETSLAVSVLGAIIGPLSGSTVRRGPTTPSLLFQG